MKKNKYLNLFFFNPRQKASNSVDAKVPYF